jgi:hypothetical protein
VRQDDFDFDVLSFFKPAFEPLFKPSDSDSFMIQFLSEWGGRWDDFDVLVSCMGTLAMLKK